MNYIRLLEFCDKTKLSVEEAEKVIEKIRKTKDCVENKGDTYISQDFTDRYIKEHTPAEPEAKSIKPEVNGSFYVKRIEELEKEIENLKQKIEDKDRIIAEYGFKFADLVSQAHIVAMNGRPLLEEETQTAKQKRGLISRIFNLK